MKNYFVILSLLSSTTIAYSSPFLDEFGPEKNTAKVLSIAHKKILKLEARKHMTSLEGAYEAEIKEIRSLLEMRVGQNTYDSFVKTLAEFGDPKKKFLNAFYAMKDISIEATEEYQKAVDARKAKVSKFDPNTADLTQLKAWWIYALQRDSIEGNPRRLFIINYPQVPFEDAFVESIRKQTLKTMAERKKSKAPSKLSHSMSAPVVYVADENQDEAPPTSPLARRAWERKRAPQQQQGDIFAHMPPQDLAIMSKTLKRMQNPEIGKALANMTDEAQKERIIRVMEAVEADRAEEKVVFWLRILDLDGNQNLNPTQRDLIKGRLNTFIPNFEALQKISMGLLLNVTVKESGAKGSAKLKPEEEKQIREGFMGLLSKDLTSKSYDQINKLMDSFDNHLYIKKIQANKRAEAKLERGSSLVGAHTKIELSEDQLSSYDSFTVDFTSLTQVTVSLMNRNSGAATTMDIPTNHGMKWEAGKLNFLENSPQFWISLPEKGIGVQVIWAEEYLQIRQSVGFEYFGIVSKLPVQYPGQMDELPGLAITAPKFTNYGTLKAKYFQFGGEEIHNAGHILLNTELILTKKGTKITNTLLKLVKISGEDYVIEGNPPQFVNE
jgi:hypothetical protein